MAHFYVTALGRGKTIGKKTGTKSTGLQTHTRGWDIGVRVVMRRVDNKDVALVYQTKGSNGDKGGSNDQLIATIIENTTTVVRVPDDCL